MIARFIGQDGSMGFRTGKKYVITLDQGGQHNWIWVKEMFGRSCPYESMEALERNWDIEKYLNKRPPTLNGFRL